MKVIKGHKFIYRVIKNERGVCKMQFKYRNVILGFVFGWGSYFGDYSEEYAIETIKEFAEKDMPFSITVEL